MVFSEKTDVPQLRTFRFTTAVTLKIRSGSPKSDQLFVMSQLYIHENLLRIQPLVHTRYCADKKVSGLPMLMPTGSAPKSIGGGTYSQKCYTNTCIPADHDSYISSGGYCTLIRRFSIKLRYTG